MVNPFVIEATVNLTAQVLVFAEDAEDACRVGEEHRASLLGAIVERSGLNLADQDVHSGVIARPAAGYECLGADALEPGHVTFETCEKHGTDVTYEW